MNIKKNTGKEYENFVGRLQQAILNSEPYSEQKNITVELNKKILDKNKIEREFDIYWEYELGGFVYKTIIECKDYESSISIDKVDALVGKLIDFPELKGVFATKKQYQSGAKIKAEAHKIPLLIVREQKEEDWQDKNGNPYIKEININTKFLLKKIENFIPFIDEDWIRENNDINTSKPVQISGINDQIIIEDIEKNEKYSLFDLENSFQFLGEEGVFTKKKEFKNAFIYSNNKKLKLNGYKIEYSIYLSHERKMKIDFKKELLGVIEYVLKRTKKTIFKNGIIKEEQL